MPPVFWPQANPLDRMGPAAAHASGGVSDGAVELQHALREASPRQFVAPRRLLVEMVVERAAGHGVLCERSAVVLTGMVQGARRELGALRVNGEQVRWDLWFPHLALAIDLDERTQRETDQKLAWATERGILYFSPDVNTDRPGRLDVAALHAAVVERRASQRGAA
jgi:hypothetical protein